MEEYKRPTFEITFPKVNEKYNWGDTVVVKATACLLYTSYQPLTKRGNNDIGGGFSEDREVARLLDIGYGRLLYPR